MHFRKSFLHPLGVLIACGQLFLVQEAAQATRGLMVCNVEGTASLSPNGDTTAATSVEKNIFLNNVADTLTTSSDASVRIGIDDFLGRVDVLANTTVGIAGMVRDVSSNLTRLSLEEGSVHVSFYRSHVDPESVFTIQTPTATVTVIGNFLPPETPVTYQEVPSYLLSAVKSDNREAFCSDPVDIFEIENFNDWEPEVTVLFDTDTVSANQALDGISESKNIPNFLIAVEPDGTTNVQVDSGMVFVEKKPEVSPSEESYSGENVYSRILAALSRDAFDDSVGIVAGPGVRVVIPPGE